MSAALSKTGNDRIAMGGNGSPFDIVSATIEDLFEETRNWADGKTIDTDEMVLLEGFKDALDTLDKALLKAGQEAEALRKDEVKPFDDGKAAVQEKFHPLIGDTKAAGKGKVPQARAALNVHRTNVNARINKINQAIADLKAAEAEAERQLEVEASRKAAAGDLDAQVQADQLAVSARLAEKDAKRANKAATTGIGLKTIRSLNITDPVLLARWLWKHRRAQCEEAHAAIAREALAGGAQLIDGADIVETQKAT